MSTYSSQVFRSDIADKQDRPAHIGHLKYVVLPIRINCWYAGILLRLYIISLWLFDTLLRLYIMLSSPSPRRQEDGSYKGFSRYFSIGPIKVVTFQLASNITFFNFSNYYPTFTLWLPSNLTSHHVLLLLER